MRNDLGPAEIVLSHTHTAPVDLVAMCRDLGLPLHYEQMPGVSGKLTRDPSSSSGFRITINRNDVEMRQRFTIAHEIAHYVLHRDLLEEGVQDDALYRSSLSDEYEQQANRYAAGMLMPARAVKEAHRKHKSIAALADLFKVSGEAMHIRLKQVGLAP